LHRWIDQLENNGCDNSRRKVGQQINPGVSPTRNTEKADAKGVSCRLPAGNLSAPFPITNSINL
jgi:hypothetical protein